MITLALRIYKWASLLFLIAYAVLITIDDFVFIRKISSMSDLGMFLLFEFLYLLMYFLVFTICYGIIAGLIIVALKIK